MYELYWNNYLKTSAIKCQKQTSFSIKKILTENTDTTTEYCDTDVEYWGWLLILNNDIYNG